MTKLTAPHGELKDASISRNVRLGFASVVIMLLASASVTYFNTRQLYENSCLLTKNNEMLDSLSECLSTMKDVEVGQGGYIITGGKQYLDLHRKASVQVKPQLERIRALFAETPEQLSNVNFLDQKIEARLDLAERSIGLRDEKGFKAAQDFAETGQGKRAMDDIRNLIEEMKTAQREFMRELELQSARSLTFAIIAQVLAALLVLGLLGVAFVLVSRDITERKHAVTALRESEQELADFFENASVGLHLVCPEGIILRANAAELALLGYAREEYVGRPIADFHADADAIGEILHRLKTGEVINDYEARLRSKDGSIKHVVINSNVFWSKGKFVHTRCFTRDITGRKRVADALRLSEIRYRRLFETAGNAILILDGDTGFIIDANPSATELTGYARPELTGKQLCEIGVFESIEVNRTALGQSRAQGTIRYSQLSIATQAGVRAEAECVAVVYEMDNKSFIQFGIHDITARIRAEEALRAARDRFRSVVDHVIHGIISIDESGVVESVNPAAERLFGYQAAEVVGQSVQMLMPEPFHGEHGQTNIIGIGREVVGLRKDGSTFPMELAVSTFPLGPRRLFTGIVQDITERKRMEEQQRERVAQLKDADRRKNEFLAMLAHELRNPLAPIQNALQLLRKNGPSDDPEATWAQDIIERQVQHMTRMVDDLLDVSRITRGMINLQKAPIDIATVVARAVELTQPLIDARKHRLIQSLPPESVRLDADLPRLAQVLANLLNNAAKYTEEGGTIWLTVERDPTASHGGAGDVVVKVRDSGIGIPPEYLPHVFDLFSQEDSSLERTHGGLGIGLTLVRVIVKMHGGVIKAFSPGAGQGSEFVLRLPALSAPPIDPPPQVDTSDAIQRAAIPARRRILVVDDNVDGARSLSTLLRQDGHEVHTAHDGFAALEIARKSPLDVAVLDIGMPHMSGLEVARRLRGELGLTDVLLVAMTGYGQDEDRHRSHEAGFNAHMVKPVDLDVLQALLARARTQDSASLN